MWPLSALQITSTHLRFPVLPMCCVWFSAPSSLWHALVILHGLPPPSWSLLPTWTTSTSETSEPLAPTPNKTFPSYGNLPSTGSRWHCTFKSHSLLVNFYFVLAHFQIKKDFSSLVFPTYVHMCTKVVVLYICLANSAANIFIWSRKFVPHAHKQPDNRFPSHQQLTETSDQQQLQLSQKQLSDLY